MKTLLAWDGCEACRARARRGGTPPRSPARIAYLGPERLSTRGGEGSDRGGGRPTGQDPLEVAAELEDLVRLVVGRRAHEARIESMQA
jgi:hypothetical protein